MKTLKKLSCVALILVLALSLMTTAFAANINITTVIPEGGTEAETYTAYKVFDVVIGGDGEPNETNPHSYTISSKIGDAVNPFFAVVRDSGYFTLEQIGETDVYNVKPTDAYGTEAAVALTTSLLAVVNDDVPVAGSVSTHGDADANGKVTYALGVDGAGYYLITSTLGSKMIVDTVGDGDITIQAKNEYPSLTKTVLNGDTYGESTTAGYGDTVTFKIDVNIPTTAAGDIVVHDAMDTQLSYAALTEGSFAAAVATESTDACTMEFTISAAQVAANKGGSVSINYTATLNAGAATDTAITNEAYLTYSSYTSKRDNATVYTYEFDLVKTKSDSTVLNGASFELYDGEDKVEFVEIDGGYRVAVAGDENTTTTIAAGNVTIKGLGNGSYTLTETVAPNGYNKLTEGVDVTIDGANLKATVTAATEEAPAAWTAGGVHVINYTGAELPSTGGIGTTIFYIVGGLLVVGACVLLVTRKRVDG